MTTLYRAVILFVCALFLTLAVTGCVTKMVRTRAGCDSRVRPGKRGACHACVSRGPAWRYFPLATPGTRCRR
ncbi:MAG: hypothetical protein KC609_21970 [Myxococcales bacterium]|nr:hypothetical protein [Myxococcales bacterium]